MEKKVPERKVTLKDDDIIYVYDKRINKCIREDCEGVVKYGLVLKTSITEDETLNCFACNKCHMKYTAYPNYVRITHPNLLHIYNQEEVTARDQKRAEDARKQALRDRRKNMPARNHLLISLIAEIMTLIAVIIQHRDRKPYEGRRKYEDRKPYGEGNTSEDRRTYRSRTSYSEDRRPYGERKTYSERKSYGEEKTYGEKKPYGNRSYHNDHKSYGPKRTLS